MNLNDLQRNQALSILKAYYTASEQENGKTPVQMDAELDDNRRRVIKEDLLPLLQQFLGGSIPLAEFKSTNDGLNKRNEYWGFKGIKGQMFFNLLNKTALNARKNFPIPILNF